jgi:pimeloyl-ACP methyl ester carboxylesterase
MLIDALSTKIFCESAGEGTPLVFVHGLGSTGNVWFAQRVALSKYFRVITLDLPGTGRSDKSDRNFSMEKWADQLNALADNLQLDKVVIVGHSMSTILATKFAAKYARRTLGLVLCGPLTELPPAGREAFVKRAETVQRDGMIAVADAVLAGALTAGTREANAALAGLYRDMLLANDPACYAAQCHALINGSARADQPHVACPTLILLGDQDAVTPLASAKAIAANIRGTQIRIVPATAHLTMAERPEPFNAALLEFLTRI